ILKDRRCKPRISPATGYILWWSEPDTAWFAWNALKNTTARLTDNRNTRFYNEENDVPDFPDEHGLAAWLNNDKALLVYDHFDIWRIDPDGKKAPERMTRGRENQVKYRYLRLDPEEHSLAPDARLLLHHFNETTKAEGYAWLDLKTGTLTPWLDGDFSYSKSPLKADKTDAMVFTRQNFQTFPDLWYAVNPSPSAGTIRPETLGQSAIRISDANPQQSEYRWGSIEKVQWTSLSGEVLEGLLVKPEGFDSGQQYPMLVNFYEKLSDGLHQHRAPDAHRSTINYTMYASRGYLIFAPDIPYRTGYPGESAYNAIMSGVTALVDKGFVDPKRIGLQGHSWGGYQAAYLVTRTNMFACAEAGAPVANMTSAYGGIRWESGLSRQFQYERQQSRIGGSLWEYPMRYLENSPLFSLDKVQTPLLILHNDKDGAVPWQQGIELFAGLRRLGKPAWMLNYNDEPHWPVKLQNRIDFQTRMQQFFDHYLLRMPMPRWMERGVPPLEKGILQGLEQSSEKN
ncbi:MAG: prolyl oligopeptidase family serine peptidase, partial [Thermoanaerobaculia bacterium]|nr:prolyl oligopeptidase family serine peptidase [Thermoanaerobaculia bacterium]